MKLVTKSFIAAAALAATFSTSVFAEGEGIASGINQNIVKSISFADGVEMHQGDKAEQNDFSLYNLSVQFSDKLSKTYLVSSATNNHFTENVHPSPGDSYELIFELNQQEDGTPFLIYEFSSLEIDTENNEAVERGEEALKSRTSKHYNTLPFPSDVPTSYSVPIADGAQVVFSLSPYIQES